jgi:hypothetical protein
MRDFVRYRAMESLCRQSAVFHPLESWRLLAQAEMWHHKAEDALERDNAPPNVAPARIEALGNAGGASRSPAG